MWVYFLNILLHTQKVFVLQIFGRGAVREAMLLEVKAAHLLGIVVFRFNI